MEIWPPWRTPRRDQEAFGKCHRDQSLLANLWRRSQRGAARHLCSTQPRACQTSRHGKHHLRCIPVVDFFGNAAIRVVRKVAEIHCSLPEHQLTLRDVQLPRVALVDLLGSSHCCVLSQLGRQRLQYSPTRCDALGIVSAQKVRPRRAECLRPGVCSAHVVH